MRLLKHPLMIAAALFLALLAVGIGSAYRQPAFGPALDEVDADRRAHDGRSRQVDAKESPPSISRQDERPSAEDEAYCPNSQTRSDCLIQLRTARATEAQARYAKYGLWLVGATIVLTALGSVLVKRTLDATRDSAAATARAAESATQQAAAAVEGNRLALLAHAAEVRPWISARFNLASSLVFRDGEGRVTIATLLKNTGVSPASDVEVEMKIVPIGVGIDELRNLSREIRQRPRRIMYGHTIFQQEALPYQVSLPIPREEIAQARAKIEAPSDIPIVPVVIACVSYYSPGGTEQHQTGLIANLAKSDASGRDTLGIHTTDGEVPIDHLRLLHTFFSGFAD